MNDHTGKYETFELHKQGTGPLFPTDHSFVHLKTVSWMYKQLGVQIHLGRCGISPLLSHTGKHPQLTQVADLGHSVPEQE